MAKKKINEKSVLSELSGSKFFHPEEAGKDDSTAQQSGESVEGGSVDNGVDSSVSQSVDQSTDEQTDRQYSKESAQRENPARERPRRGATASATASPKRRQDTGRFDDSPILSRPKSFYITKKQDADIDDIAESIAEVLEGKIAHKIDRSVVVRLILESQDWTSEEAIDDLAKHLVNKLVSQLVD